jgi:hypothetical protein
VVRVRVASRLWQRQAAAMEACPASFRVPMARLPECGHDLGSFAGPGLGGVFAVGDVADVVQGLHLSSRLRRCEVIRGVVGEFGVDAGGPAADTVDVGA